MGKRRMRLKRTRIGIFMFLVLVLCVMDGKTLPSPSFIVREYDGLPCMWQNGLPYFGRFKEAGSRDYISLAGDWKFAADRDDSGEAAGYYRPEFDDSGWGAMPVPGVWNVKDSELSHYEGAAWYRRTFTATDKIPEGLVRLHFDGVIFHARVWLNGQYLGAHSGGYSAWSLDATDAIRPGVNQVTVRVDNRRDYTDVPPKLWEGEKLGWWPYGGISRLAMVEFAPEVCINKLVIETDALKGRDGMVTVSGLVYNHGDEPADVSVYATVPSRGKWTPQEFGERRITVPAKDCARFEYPWVIISGVEHWSNQSPSRYPLEVVVTTADGKKDWISEMFGMRKFEIKDGGVYLNFEPYWMCGMNRHEDLPETGLYQPLEMMERDMALLRELNVNHMRPAHYPNDPRWLDLCDREGITVIHEIPLYQAGSGLMKWVEARARTKRKDKTVALGAGYNTLGQMTDPDMLMNAEQQLIEMIERDRNHPSVIMWSVGNENFTFIPSSRKMYKRLIATARRFDPSRPVTFAIMCGPGISPLLEQTGDMADVLCLNEYYGWYFGEAEGVAGLLDRFHKKYPDKPIIVSEFGAGTVYGRHEDPAEKFSEEYQVQVLETQYRIMLERPYVVGAMPWIFADFRCPWFMDEHPVYHMNLKGIVDYERNKKAAFDTMSRIYGEIESKGRPESR
jgi:beta-glucuronidase